MQSIVNVVNSLFTVETKNQALINDLMLQCKLNELKLNKDIPVSVCGSVLVFRKGRTQHKKTKNIIKTTDKYRTRNLSCFSSITCAAPINK